MERGGGELHHSRVLIGAKFKTYAYGTENLQVIEDERARLGGRWISLFFQTEINFYVWTKTLPFVMVVYTS